MSELREYRRKAGAHIVAIRMNLDMIALPYRKWGGVQIGKQGDWLVENQGEVYTVDAESFAKTYMQVSAAVPGVYAKTGVVWAMEADTDGKVKTKEGYSAYQKGDMLVWNDPNQADGYAMTKDKFFSLYETEGSAIA